MNFIKDNTIPDPAAIVGTVLIGDTYLVPPIGAGGDWTGKEDKLAVWGGSIWSFVSAPTGAQYQVDSGPNIGVIYTRTATPVNDVEFVSDSEFLEDPFLDAAWTITTTGAATAEWINSGGTFALDLAAAVDDDYSEALVEITTVVGEVYDLTWQVSNTSSDAPATIEATVKDGGSFVTILTRDLSDGVTPQPEQFTATSEVTTIAFRASSVADGIAAMRIDYIRVRRRQQCITNGNFDDVFDGWDSQEPPWEVNTGSGGVFDVNTAIATIDYPGHDPDPAIALRQTVAGLVPGVYYRLDFDISANFTRGLMTIAVDDAPLVNIVDNGHKTFFYRATAASHTFQFPLTYTGGGPPFELEFDNVSLESALWIANPVAKPVISAQSTVICSVVGPKAVAALIAAASLVTCGTSTDQNVFDVRIAAVSTMTAGTQVVTSVPINPIIAAKSTVSIINTGSNVSTGILIAAKSSMSVKTVDLGDYTAAMAVDSITELWSSSPCDCANEGCGTLQIAALECLNAAMQRLNASGREWGFVSNVSLSLGPKTSLDGEIDLPKDVIAVRRVVFEPALDVDSTSYGSFVLRPVRSRHEIEAYRLSSDRLAWPLKPAESYLAHSIIPIGYFVEAEDLRSTTGSGPPSLRIMFGPKFSPATPYKVEVQAHIEPPRLTCQSLAEGTVLPIPHRFAETLLVPLAKYYALSNRWFRREDLREAVQLQARDALMLTGELQPTAPEAGKEERSKAP